MELGKVFFWGVINLSSSTHTPIFLASFINFLNLNFLLFFIVGVDHP